jgi:lipopolysaccharide/colanic/teichoic acid biosynthesis glycosyltransferase
VFIKRFFDVVCALAGLVILGPLLLWIAWRIRREDGGPVFYRGVRVGLHGKPFRIFKFRTMVVDAEKLGASSTSDDDPRITGIGKLLRKYKLDELPQLINVLKGDMSFVGPRPEVKKFTDLYTEEEKAILTVRPGITDWASIWNSDEAAVLAGAEDADEAYLKVIRPTKLRLQLKYVRERSFWTDLKIIFLTFQALLRPQSAAVKEIRTGNFHRRGAERAK